MTPRVSVCMATYNGARFIRAQLESILLQLGPGDELIIGDDNSTDGTWELITGLGDPRVHARRNPTRLGHAQNFVAALARASGRYIALSDQDDIWVAGRLERMLGVLAPLPPASLVIGEFVDIDESDRVFPSRLNAIQLGVTAGNRYAQLLRIFSGRVKYFGCTFLFERDLLRHVVPMPRAIEAHDVWIAMNACLYGRLVHLEENTLWHRIHDRNLTPNRRRSGVKILRSRAQYAFHLARLRLTAGARAA